MRRSCSWVILVALLAAGCGGEDVPADLTAEATVRIAGRSGSWEIPVEIAATSRARTRGLMGRDYLPPDRGMLFLYREAGERGFWMKDCLVPIDAAFLAEDGRIVNVAEMSPEPGVEFPRSHRSLLPVRLVLEMPGGWFRDHGVGAGDRVEVPASILRIVPE